MNSDINFNKPWIGMNRNQVSAHCEAYLKQGVGKEKLCEKMVAEGCPPTEAKQIIDAAAGKLGRSAGIVLAVGLALIILGIAVTVATYRTAYEMGGGVYIVWFGAVISGTVCVVFGLRSLLRLR